MLTDEWIKQAAQKQFEEVDPDTFISCMEEISAFARAIESAACADRDARIAQLEQRNRDLYEDVRRFKEYALSEKDARMALERELAEVRKQLDAQKDEWLSWDAKRSALEKDAGRFVAFASGKANIMQSMIDTICKQQPTDVVWWRAAIDAAMKGTP